MLIISSGHRETLQEAYRTLEEGEVKGLLLDAYVAGSHSMKDLFDQQLRVKEVIKLPKGIGVVLSGEAMKLLDRVRDYIRSKAALITKMIENSTTPLQVRQLVSPWVFATFKYFETIKTLMDILRLALPDEGILLWVMALLEM